MTKEASNFCLRMASNYGLTHGYTALTQTVNGTSGTHTLTASATLATASCVPGATIKANTDAILISGVVTTTITTVPALSTNYTAASLNVDVVSAWNDSSGFGSSATQATALNRPAFVANVVNSLPGIYYKAGTQALTLATNTHTDNLFVGGGTLYAILDGKSAGAAGLGRIIEKVTSGGASAWNLLSVTASGGFYRLLFNQVTSGTAGAWRTNSVVQLDTEQVISIYYNSSTPTVPPVFRVQGVVVTTVVSTAPTGTALNDAGGAYTIGNRAARDRGFDGAINSLYMYKRQLYTYETECMDRFLANMWGLTLFQSGSQTYGARPFDFSTPDTPAAVPMILALHGGGGDAATFEIQLQLGALLGQLAVLVFPTATKNNAGDNTWNSGGFQTFNHAPDSKYLADLVDWVTSQVALSGFTITEVYLVGHSNGGMMSYRLVIDHPTKFAGVFAISADVQIINPDVYTGRIQQWHGQSDTNVPLAGGVGIGGVYYTPVIPTIQKFTHVNNGTGVVVGSSDPYVVADFNVINSPAAHIMSSMANVLVNPPYSTTFAQLIYNFVIG